MNDTPVSWFKRQLLAEAVPSDNVTMATSCAFLYGSGASLVLITAIFNRAPETPLGVVYGVIGVAYAVTLSLWLGRRTFPKWIYPYVVMLGSGLITVLVYFDGADASAYSLLYVWAALYAFYFFRPRLALAETAWIALLSGVVLYSREANNVPLRPLGDGGRHQPCGRGHHSPVGGGSPGPGRPRRADRAGQPAAAGDRTRS